MTKKLEVYKCDVCGNIVEILHTGQGELVCCGQPMVKQAPKTDEEGLVEKHRPVVSEESGVAKIKIGSVPHPMEDEHYIEWVEVVADGKICRYELSPGDDPETKSCLKGREYVRAYCNVHGLWKSQVNIFRLIEKNSNPAYYVG